nr:uncharacterized mitochondrial protein AtMg00810-like [Tanacetum cinerariifolium]
LMYLTASRPDIMFAVSACSRHQLEAYSNSDYAGSYGDRKSTTGGCQFLGRRLISWQCKKQTVVATSSTEAEYVAAASCCGHVLWIQNQIGYPKLQVVQVLLLVVQVRADDLVSAGGCTLPAGSYSFLLLDWFLLVVDDHNKVAYLEKGKGREAYEQILDFLNRSHIRYALTHRPTMVFDTLVKQYWATATVRTLEAGPSDIITTIDGTEVVVTESLIKTQLQLDDVNGLYEFPLHDVLDGIRAIGFIMDGMLGNVGSKRHKFLMYPCFLQMIFGIQTSDPSPRPTFDFTAKLFSNMKLNWDGPHMPLLVPMLVVPAGGDAAGAAVNVAAGPGPSSAPREPSHRPEQELTLNSSIPPSLPSSSAAVGPTTSSRPPSPSRHPSVPEDSREGGGDFVSSPQSNEAPQTPTAMAASGAEDSATLTVLSLKLDRCLHRVTTLENEHGITKKVLGGAVLKLV